MAKGTLLAFVGLVLFVLAATLFPYNWSVPKPVVMTVPEWGLVDSNPQVLQNWFQGGIASSVEITPELLFREIIDAHPKDVAYYVGREPDASAVQVTWMVDLGGVFAYHRLSSPTHLGFKVSQYRLEEGGKVRYSFERSTVAVGHWALILILVQVLVLVIASVGFVIESVGFEEISSR